MGLREKTEVDIEFTAEDHNIRVINWWQVEPLQSELKLLVDDVLIAESHKIGHLDPNEPILSAYDVSERIDRIDVFVAGLFRVKFCVRVNGTIHYEDRLSWIDRLYLKFFSRKKA